MAQVGNNNEPLHERALFVYTGSVWVPLKGDSDGNIISTLLDDQNVQARGYGWIAGAWQKQPINLGYSSDKSQTVTLVAPGGGNQTLDGDAVPSGEIWELQAIFGVNNTRATPFIRVGVIVNGVEIILNQIATPAQYFPTMWSGKLILSEDDIVRALFAGVTASDSLVLAYHAVVIDTDL